jgi:hypothetical protein
MPDQQNRRIAIYCDWAKPSGGRALGFAAVGTSSPGTRGAGS